MKRYRDTGVWDEDWYQMMPMLYQHYLNWIWDHADHAGLLRPNKLSFCRSCSPPIDPDSLNQTMFLNQVNADKERIFILPNGRWWLTGFIRFHYGKKGQKSTVVLNLKSRVIRSAVELLDLNEVPYKSKNYGFEVKMESTSLQLDPIYGSKRQKTKDMEEGVGGTVLPGPDGRIEYPAWFEDTWKYYPIKNGKLEGFVEASRLPETFREALLWRVKAYATIPLPEGLSHPLMSSWVAKRRFDDDLVVRRGASMQAQATRSAASAVAPKQEMSANPDEDEAAWKAYEEAKNKIIHKVTEPEPV